MGNDGGPAAVIVFSRAPVPGRVKRRLIPALGPEGAARLQAWMTERAVATAVAAGVGPVSLWCTPDDTHPLFRRLAADTSVALAVQSGADLGARMHAAAAQGLSLFARVVLVGSDCPELGPADLAGAVDRLDRVDVVLGAARDGGYVLLGLRRVDPGLFEGVDWGTPGVLAQTQDRLRELGWTWEEVGPYRDIDRPEDLDALPPGAAGG